MKQMGAKYENQKLTIGKLKYVKRPLCLIALFYSDTQLAVGKWIKQQLVGRYLFCISESRI